MRNRIVRRLQRFLSHADDFLRRPQTPTGGREDEYRQRCGLRVLQFAEADDVAGGFLHPVAAGDADVEQALGPFRPVGALIEVQGGQFDGAGDGFVVCAGSRSRFVE